MPRHADRSLGRQFAFQFLFSLDFTRDSPAVRDCPDAEDRDSTCADFRPALTEFWRMNPASLTENACSEDEEPASNDAYVRNANVARAKRCAEELIEGVYEAQATLDAQIASALDNWKPERVGRIEWIIMRLALYELVHCPDTPSAVVVAEAVRLANIFGDAESPRFVNGLLDNLAANARDCPDRDAP